MSQQNGTRTQRRRALRGGGGTGATPERVTSEELAILKGHHAAVTKAQQALADAELEFQHAALLVRRAHGWDGTMTVSLDTGDVAPGVPVPRG